jgi:hypothetical protein
VPEDTLPPYLEYLEVCQRIRQQCSCDLRVFDRVLYMAEPEPGSTAAAPFTCLMSSACWGHGCTFRCAQNMLKAS